MLSVPLPELRLLAGLRYDPGYLVLMDILQAQLDNLTDELAAPELRDDDLPGKVRYWQSFREILRLLRTTPESFAPYAEEDKKADEHPALDAAAPWNLRNFFTLAEGPQGE